MSNLTKKNSTKTCEWDLETRMRVVIRHEDGWSQYKIAKSFNPPLPRTTVQSIIKAYREKGTVVNRARLGRPPLHNDSDKKITEEVKKDSSTRRANLEETANRLFLDVSLKTL